MMWCLGERFKMRLRTTYSTIENETGSDAGSETGSETESETGSETRSGVGSSQDDIPRLKYIPV